MFERGRRRLRAVVLLVVSVLCTAVLTAPSASADTRDTTKLTITCPDNWPVYTPDEVVCDLVVVDVTNPHSIPTGGISDPSHDILIPLNAKGHGIGYFDGNDSWQYNGDSTHAPSASVNISGFENRTSATALYCPQSWPAGLPVSCLVVVSDTSPATGDQSIGQENVVTVTDDDDPAISATCELSDVLGPESCSVHFHAEANPGTTHHLHVSVQFPYADYMIPAEGATTMDVGPIGSGTLTPVIAGMNAAPLYYGQGPVTVTLQQPTGQPVPAGVVDVFDNGHKLFGDYLNSSGVLTIGANRLDAGDHSLTLNYRGDTNYAQQSWGTFGLSVSPVTTSTQLTQSAKQVTTHQPVTFTATVANTVGSVTPPGYVVFSRDGKPYAEREVDSGVAKWTTVYSAKGVHHVSAKYVGPAADGSSADFSSSSSGTAALTVNPLAKGAPVPVGTFYGSTAPNIGGVDQYGNNVDLKSQRGKWVLLVFDALWCPAGQAQEQQLDSLTRHMRDAHIPFSALTFAYEKTIYGGTLGKGDAEQFARSNGSMSPLIGARSQQVRAQMERMAVAYTDATVEENVGIPGVPEPDFAVPVDVVIDPNGVVQGIQSGRLDLDQIQNVLHPSYQLPDVTTAAANPNPDLPATAVDETIGQLRTMTELPAAKMNHLAAQLLAIKHRMDPSSAAHDRLAAAFAAARATTVAYGSAHQLTKHDVGQLRFDIDWVADILNESGGNITPHHRTVQVQ